MINRVLTLICILIVYGLKLYSQQESFIELERIKTQEEFQDANVSVEPIPQSRLIEELSKPGNEMLLEQFQNSKLKNESETKRIQEEKLKEIHDPEDLNIEDQEDDQKEIEKIEDEDEKKISSIVEMMFDRELYYRSIMDFYGYKIFFDPDPKNPLPVTSVTTNMEHIVGPGDSFILSLWGSTELRTRLTVSPEGTIFIQNVGMISVHGLKVKELEEKLKKILSKNYKTIAPAEGNPSTFIDVTYDRLNTIVVFVNGEVVVPGPYELSPNSTIISALTKAGGVTAKGTLRDIQVIRNGKIVTSFDVYDYLNSGKDVTDLLLKANDNIFVRPRLSTVELEGEVFNPLKYELKPEETLEDLIKYSGGLLSTASIDIFTIERLTPVEKRKKPTVLTEMIDFPLTTNDNGELKLNPVKLHDLDKVTIKPIPRILTNFVAVNGAVYRSGRYQFREGMTLSNLIEKSGGLLADAFIKKAELIRTYPDTKNEYVSLDLNDPEDMNFELKSLDSIHIYSEWMLKNKKMVLVTGYIKNPGITVLNDSMRVSDLIFSRGGIEDDDQKKLTYMERADIVRFNADGITTRVIPINLTEALNGNKENNILLENNDHLRIYSRYVNTTKKKIYISGFVKEEGTYNLRDQMTVEDIILEAGGFKEGAYEFQADVFRKNLNSDILSRVYNIQINRNLFSEKRTDQFYLEQDDYVVIRKDPDKEKQKVVYISGQVKFPGLYTIEKKNETLRSLINRSGGLTEEAFISGIEYERDSIRIYSDYKESIYGKLKSDIILKDRDSIYVPSRPSTVSVEGFVYTPGLLTYRDDWSLDDYIEAAGGIIKDLEYEAGEPIVYYPGGNAEVDDGWFFSPSVKEGSKIVIPNHKKEPKTDVIIELRAWMSIITSAITLYVLVEAVKD